MIEKTPTMPAKSVDDYRAAMEESFRRRYGDGRDFWSADDGLALAAAVFLDALGPEPASVLDIGAGKGRDAMRFLEAGHLVTAIDLHRDPIWDDIETRWPGRVVMYTGLFQDWSPSRVFDAIFDNGCFHHQHEDDYPEYLAKVHSALRPGGVAQICSFTPPDASASAGYFEVMDHGRIGRHFTAAEARTLLERHGFVWLRAERIAGPDPTADYLACFCSKPTGSRHRNIRPSRIRNADH